MEIDFKVLKDWRDEARRTLEGEQERLMERCEQIGTYLKALEVTDELTREIDRLNDEALKRDEEIDALRQQLQEERERSQELEMRLSELSKLSAGVARKSSNEEVLKALRTFVNKSKQKRIEKRTAVKEMVLELVVANGIVLPEDLATTLEGLDDEEREAKVVNVEGNYNDIHDNKRVDMNDKRRAENGRK